MNVRLGRMPAAALSTRRVFLLTAAPLAQHQSALADDQDDTLIWDQVYLAVAESTPPPRPIASSHQDTPWSLSTSSFVNSSEYRQDVDGVLKLELGPLYVGLRHFHKKFFGSVRGLETASKAVFKKCKEGSSPLFNEGWSGWPKDANQDDVLNWFADLNGQLVALAEEYTSTLSRRQRHRRRPLAQPNKPIQGSPGERKMDIGFVSDPGAGRDSRCHWSQILVPGELKSNPSADIPSKACLISAGTRGKYLLLKTRVGSSWASLSADPL